MDRHIAYQDLFDSAVQFLCMIVFELNQPFEVLIYLVVVDSFGFHLYRSKMNHQMRNGGVVDIGGGMAYHGSVDNDVCVVLFVVCVFVVEGDHVLALLPCGGAFACDVEDLLEILQKEKYNQSRFSCKEIY